MQRNERDQIANGVRAELARHRMTQTQAAVLLCISRQAMSKKLLGEIPLRAEELAKIADALGIPVSRFFTVEVTA
jgi:transcriptional regulator with XRE-family HTH domain